MKNKEITLLALIVMLLLSAGCEESKPDTTEHSENSSLEFFSSTISSVSSIASSSSFTSLSSATDISSVSVSSSSSETLIQEQNNSYLMPLYENEQVVKYGEGVKLLSEPIVGKWFFTNNPPQRSEWIDIEFHEDGNCSTNVQNKEHDFSCIYGVNDSSNTLYVIDDEIFNYGYYLGLDILERDEASGCLKVQHMREWVRQESRFAFGKLYKAVDYLCPIDVLDNSKEEESLLFDNNNSALATITTPLLTYSGEVINLYRGDKVKLGEHLLNGSWSLSGLSFDFLIRDKDSLAEPHAGIEPTNITILGVNDVGSKLYYQNLSVVDDDIAGLREGEFESYLVIEIVEVLNYNCYLINAKDIFYSLDIESYLIKMCKEY